VSKSVGCGSRHSGSVVVLQKPIYATSRLSRSFVLLQNQSFTCPSAVQSANSHTEGATRGSVGDLDTATLTEHPSMHVNGAVPPASAMSDCRDLTQDPGQAQTGSQAQKSPYDLARQSRSLPSFAHLQSPLSQRVDRAQRRPHPRTGFHQHCVSQNASIYAVMLLSGGQSSVS
jgi:hypothetical protein